MNILKVYSKTTAFLIVLNQPQLRNGTSGLIGLILLEIVTTTTNELILINNNDPNHSVHDLGSKIKNLNFQEESCNDVFIVMKAES